MPLVCLAVEVALTPDSDISGSKFVEVTGKVSDGGSSLDGNLIREFTTVDCGENVGTYQLTARTAARKNRQILTHSLYADMGLVENTVQLSAKFPALFSDSA